MCVEKDGPSWGTRSGSYLGQHQTPGRRPCHNGTFRATRKLRGRSYVEKKKNFFFFFVFSKILAGGRCPPDPPGFGWGGKAPPDPPPKRSFVTFDRGGQTGPPRSNAFFSAPLTTRALPTTVRPDVWPDVRPNARPRPHLISQVTPLNYQSDH